MNPPITVSRPQLSTPATNSREKLTSSKHKLLNVQSTLKANRSYIGGPVMKQTSSLHTGPKRGILARAGSRMNAPPPQVRTAHIYSKLPQFYLLFLFQIKDSAGTELTPQTLQLSTEPYIGWVVWEFQFNSSDNEFVLGRKQIFNQTHYKWYFTAENISQLFSYSVYSLERLCTYSLSTIPHREVPLTDLLTSKLTLSWLTLHQLLYISLRWLYTFLSSCGEPNTSLHLLYGTIVKISGLRHNLCYLYKSISCNETLRFEMKFSILQNISIFLLLLLLSLHVCCGIEVCEQNSHIRCLHYDALTLCTVTGTDGTVVSQGILSCSVQSFIQIDFSAVTNIEVDLRINSSGTVSLTSNAMPTVILLSASSVSNSVTSLLQSVVIFNFTNSPNFTGFFPNLDAVQFTNPIYSNIPTFVHNDKLTSIVVQGAYLPVGGDFAISSGFIGGLTRLRMFSWTDSSITSIVPGAFSNLDQLSSLKLSDNKITHLRQYSFQGTHLPFLYYLWLSGNNISRVDNLAFDDLVLNQLYLDNNPFFPLESLANISSLQSLTLANNGYSYLSPDLIYNLDFHSFNLANNPFNCSCALQWANIAQIFITFNQAICAYPSEFNGVSITDPAPYVNCTQVLSYQCFNHSILCKGSSQCTNTPTTAYCSCSHVGENYAYSQLACVFLIDVWRS